MHPSPFCRSSKGSPTSSSRGWTQARQRERESVCAQRATCLGPVSFAVWLWVQHFASLSLKGGKNLPFAKGLSKGIWTQPWAGETKAHLFPCSLLDFMEDHELGGAGVLVVCDPRPSGGVRAAL